MSQQVALDDAAWARLGSYLFEEGVIPSHEIVATLLTGGQSNPTYRLVSGDKSFVLRKKPAGDLLPSAHAIDREYGVMKALQTTPVPVPEMLVYCEDESLIGTPFYVMPFLQGRVFFDQTLPGMTRDERAQVYANMNQAIAQLHRIDPEAIGLGDYGKAGNYFGRQIRRWSQQYQEHHTDRIASLEHLIEWLPDRIPAGDLTTIVHGDYRLDNVMLHATEPKVIAVLDWELSTLGHPLADFSYHCMSWHIPPSLWRGIGGLDLAELGIPSERQYIEQYVSVTGYKGVQEHWNFYLAYNFFRIAAILYGIGERARQGTATASDAMEMAAKAEPLADIGWHYAQQYQAQRG
ncbi:phosphotransferase family protein [Orrella daihaiensis]|uniref:Phosphotransferase family protein n=1 Tax=Orrella daihaiensis TaxID=2782176 RepID=A0ABY4AMT5_9BURK|nr:phosphotransferase family protein [Orrella daihaiensis]UOD50936.1 phosphotransferase family protein [Orrella daihaiensis]